MRFFLGFSAGRTTGPDQHGASASRHTQKSRTAPLPSLVGIVGYLRKGGAGGNIAYTGCQKFCPFDPSWVSGGPPSLRATQGRRIFVQGTPRHLSHARTIRSELLAAAIKVLPPEKKSSQRTSLSNDSYLLRSSGVPYIALESKCSSMRSS